MAIKKFFTKNHLESIVEAGPDVMDASLAKFPLHGCTVDILRSLIRAILISPGRWFHYSKSGAVKRSITNVTRRGCQAHAMFFLIFAAKLLQVLNLGKVLMTMAFAGGGNYYWFFVKRQSAPDNVQALAHMASLKIRANYGGV